MIVIPLSACGGQDSDSSYADDDLGSAQLAVTTVPSGITCIRVTATPAAGAAIVKTFSISGSSASLDMGRLPAGPVTFTGDAFNVACTSIGTNQPIWATEPVGVTLRRGQMSVVQLDFRRNDPVFVSANFVGNIRKVTGGTASTYLLADTGVWRVGGAPGQSDALQWTLDSSFGDAIDIAAGPNHTCILRADGSAWCWGMNASGQLGNGTTTNSVTPVQAATVVPFTAITVGLAHTCATGLGGTYCWGDNQYGQLGDGTTISRSSPVPSQGASRLRALSSRFNHTLGVTDQGAVVAWGFNGNGELGDGTTTNRTSWVSINEAPVLSVTTGFGFSCAARHDGSVRCWGANTYGQIGDGTTVNSTTPKLVSALGGEAVEVKAGAGHVCARLASTEVKCWGYNAFGQLGDKTVTNRATPGLTKPTLAATSFGVGSQHVCALTDQLPGLLYCWGSNSNGQLASGTTHSQFGPTRAVLVP